MGSLRKKSVVLGVLALAGLAAMVLGLSLSSGPADAAGATRQLGWTSTGQVNVSTTCPPCGSLGDGGIAIACPNPTRFQVFQNKSTNTVPIYEGPYGISTTTGFEILPGAAPGMALTEGTARCCVSSGSAVLLTVCLN